MYTILFYLFAFYAYGLDEAAPQNSALEKCKKCVQEMKIALTKCIKMRSRNGKNVLENGKNVLENAKNVFRYHFCTEVSM